MSDPAVEAAQRAVGDVDPDGFVGGATLAAAREALTPIRMRIDELRRVYSTRFDQTADGVRHALDEIDRLVR